MKTLVCDSWPAPIAPVHVAGIAVAPLSTAQWVELMIADCRAARESRQPPRYHSALNGNVISTYHRDPAFRQAIRSADAVAADGVSVLWGARLFAGQPIPDRAATTDLFHDLARAAEREGLSMYFLGAVPSENAAAVANVARLYPRLKIAGARHGYFTPDEEADVIRAIVEAKPDILWVAMGVPREDQFVVRNLSRLQGIGWVKTCGGLYNFLSGLRPRAPQWMQQAGLEWVYRMAQEPRRLFWRYFTTNIHSIWLMALAGDQPEPLLDAGVIKPIGPRDEPVAPVRE